MSQSYVPFGVQVSANHSDILKIILRHTQTYSNTVIYAYNSTQT